MAFVTGLNFTHCRRVRQPVINCCTTKAPESGEPKTATTGRTFRELYPRRIPEWLHARLETLSFDLPTPIQERTLPDTLGVELGELGRDVILHAETGSGKTLAYLLPVLANLQMGRSSVQTLIIVPTPELSVQVVHVARRLTGGEEIPVLAVSSADRRTTQQLRHTAPRIVVGDAPSLHALYRAGRLRMDLVRIVVVDEFDAILDAASSVSALGSLLSVRSRSERQTLLASATVPSRQHFIGAIRARKWTRPDVLHVRAHSSGVPSTLEHAYVLCRCGQKEGALRALLGAITESSDVRVMVFISDTRDALALSESLDGVCRSVGLDGDLLGPLRRDAMSQFRDGERNCLISSELGARGLDVDDVRYVIHLDMPQSSDRYLHRAGRCARAGKKGTSILLVEAGEKFMLARIANSLDVTFARIRSAQHLIAT